MGYYEDYQEYEILVDLWSRFSQTESRETINRILRERREARERSGAELVERDYRLSRRGIKVSIGVAVGVAVVSSSLSVASILEMRDAARRAEDQSAAWETRQTELLQHLRDSQVALVSQLRSTASGDSLQVVALPNTADSTAGEIRRLIDRSAASAR